MNKYLDKMTLEVSHLWYKLQHKVKTLYSLCFGIKSIKYVLILDKTCK